MRGRLGQYISRPGPDKNQALGPSWTLQQRFALRLNKSTPSIMKTLIILLGFVACTFAVDCGMLQRIKVKQQWASVYSSGIAREDFGEAIWKAVFAQAPQARALFKRVGADDIHSPAFKAHIARVNGGLDMAISLLDNEPTLNAELAHLNGQHKERGIPSNYYDVFIRALHAVVPAALGRCFDHPAWDACSDVIIAGIRQ